jgi:hypothetical protein
MNTSRKFEEIMFWRIVTEIWRRFPQQFELIEAHPSGGLGDYLTLMTKTEPSLFAISVGRGNGSVFVEKEAFGLANDMIKYLD